MSEYESRSVATLILNLSKNSCNCIKYDKWNFIEQENVLFEHWILCIGFRFPSRFTSINPDYKKTDFSRDFICYKSARV